MLILGEVNLKVNADLFVGLKVMEGTIWAGVVVARVPQFEDLGKQLSSDRFQIYGRG